MSAFKSTGKYDAQIHEFEAKPVTDKMLDTFRPLIVNEYAKCTKQHKSTTKSVGFKIANAAISMAAVDAKAQAAEEGTKAAWAITKVANVLQMVQDRQTEKMMETFKQMVEGMKGNNATTQPKQPKQKCKHCGLVHKMKDET